MPWAEESGIPVGFEASARSNTCGQGSRMGNDLDIGHAYMAAKSDEGFFAYIDEFAGRIAEVHHNGVNHYWGGFMEHQPPI